MEEMKPALASVDYDAVVDALIEEYPDKVQQALDKPSLAQWFTGKAMQMTNGKCNPAVFDTILKRKFSDMRGDNATENQTLE